MFVSVVHGTFCQNPRLSHALDQLLRRCDYTARASMAFIKEEVRFRFCDFPKKRCFPRMTLIVIVVPFVVVTAGKGGVMSSVGVAMVHHNTA